MSGSASAPASAPGTAPADFPPVEPAPHATFVRMRAEGAIPFQYCTGCERAVFFPRVLCPHCGSVELEWRRSSGLGTVYSQTFVPHRGGGGHHVLLIDLDEGFRLMGSAAGEDESATADAALAGVAIGTRVRGRVAVDPERPDAEPRFVFASEGGPAAGPAPAANAESEAR